MNALGKEASAPQRPPPYPPEPWLVAPAREAIQLGPVWRKWTGSAKGGKKKLVLSPRWRVRSRRRTLAMHHRIGGNFL